MKNLFPFLIAFLLLHPAVIAQPTLSIGQLTGCVPGTVVNVPVSTNNFNGLGYLSFACTIAYDSLVLEYIDHTNMCPAFNNVFLVTNAANAEIAVAWFSVDSIIYPDGQIFDLTFNYLGGSTNLTWNPLCAAGLITLNNGAVSGPATGISRINGQSRPGGVYPNPVHGLLTMDNPFGPVLTFYTVSDVCGRTILEGSSNDRQVRVDMQTVPGGMYFINLTCDKGSVSAPLIKSK